MVKQSIKRAYICPEAEDLGVILEECFLASVFGKDPTKPVDDAGEGDVDGWEFN